MPNRDRTGPEGRGRRTGRGSGICPPNEINQETGRKLLGRRRRFN